MRTRSYSTRRRHRRRGRNWAVIETARYGDAGTVDLPHSVEEVIEDLGQYVILKDHWPEWDKAHTGTVVFGESLEEAVNRVIDVHTGLRLAVGMLDAP